MEGVNELSETPPGVRRHPREFGRQVVLQQTKGPTNAEKLITAAGYFRNNQHRMNYLELREEDWPIGSGVVESGAKQIKARLCGPGMRWSRKGPKTYCPSATPFSARDLIRCGPPLQTRPHLEMRPDQKRELTRWCGSVTLMLNQTSRMFVLTSVSNFDSGATDDTCRTACRHSALPN